MGIRRYFSYHVISLYTLPYIQSILCAYMTCNSIYLRSPWVQLCIPINCPNCVYVHVCVLCGHLVLVQRRVNNLTLSPLQWECTQSVWEELVQLTVATPPSSAPSTWLPLPMDFILAMMSVKVSFTVFSRSQPSLSLSGSSGLVMVDREVCTYFSPTVTATYNG